MSSDDITSPDAAPPSKRAKTSLSSSSSTTSPSSSAPYQLYYWPGIPGRGEFVRLLFEATGTPYENITTVPKPKPANPSTTAADSSGTDANASPGIPAVVPLISPTNHGTETSPPPLAPPILKHGDLVLSQTANILLYLGPRLGLAGEAAATATESNANGNENTASHNPNAIYTINALALTALDGFSDEAHETHHPIAVSAFYADQKAEAIRRSADYIKNRLPKFLSYFCRVLAGPCSQGGKWLYGNRLTYADLVLWQGMDGVMYAFPNAMQRLRQGHEGVDYSLVFEHYERVKTEVDGIKAYLESGRRLPYGNGIWRRYEELDVDVDVDVDVGS